SAGGAAVAESEPGRIRSIERIVFSSNELPAELDDRARFSLRHDLYTARYGSLALSRPPDRPFSVRLQFAPFGPVALGGFEGTIHRVRRSAGAVAAHGPHDFCLLVDRGRSSMVAAQCGREATLAPGAATLFSDTEAGGVNGGAENAWHALVVPRRPLLDLVSHAEDVIATAVDRDAPAMRYLARYLTL